MILKGLEEGANVDSVYLDFSKAFDKVDKGILARKMKQMGICGLLGEWIFPFCLQESKSFLQMEKLLQSLKLPVEFPKELSLDLYSS